MDYNSFIAVRGSIFDSELIVCDILSRLPVKSLMRFKCVCKHLQYFIEEDDYLIHSHYNRSKTRPGLIIIAPRFYLPIPVSGMVYCPKDRVAGYALPKEISFLSADIVLGENESNATTAIVNTVRNAKDDKFKCNVMLNPRKKEFHHNHILKPVTGLICFVYWNLKFMVTFCIYNVCTREVMVIKHSAFFREARDEHSDWCNIPHTSFQLGFDPVTKEHKLIAVFTVRKKMLGLNEAAYTVCEALTLGTNTWRRIDDVPLYNFPNSSVSVNGSIYWHCTKKISLRKYEGTEYYGEEECPSIVAFDVGSEKFRLIPNPGFMIDQPSTEKEKRSSLVVDERLAYFCRKIVSYTQFGGTANLWILDGMHQKENETGSTITTASPNMNWTEEIISLPSDWGYFVVKCHDIAGSDQLILTCYKWSEFVSVHSYNRKRKTFRKIEISGIGYVPDIHYTYLFTTFVESLFCVNKKQPKQQQQQLPPHKYTP